VFLARKNTADLSAADPDDPNSFYQDTSIQALQGRGLAMLACHTAIEEQARGIIKKGLAPAGASPTDVADDILTHLIPGTIVVPSMVATVAVLQQVYHYTYVALTF
jgi:intracellular sulfur oxidation DsrE/DsrF family protein